MWVYVTISVRPAVCSKNFNVQIFSDAINIINVKLYMVVVLWALPVHTTFSDLDCSSRSQQCWTGLIENLCSDLIKLKLVWLFILSSRLWLDCCFWFFCVHMFKGGNWHIFLLKKLLCCPFLRHCGRKIFQTLHDYSLAWYLHFHGRFDDLDFVSRSKVCKKCKLQIVLCRFLFRFLSTVV